MNKTAVLVFFILLGLVSGCQKKAAPAGRRIDVVMRKYSIEPAEIRMKSGETVDLEITTADVQHGFDVPQLGIKEPVQPGKTTSVVLKAPVPGEYAVRCGIICGPHHEDMTAKLVVN